MVGKIDKRPGVLQVRIALAAMVLTLAGAPVQAEDVAGRPERLHVGSTNIYCVQAPCPWRGITRADDMPASPASLLWSEEVLPPMEGDPESVDRIMRAWNEGECLVLDGAFVDGVLVVESLAGTCP